MATVGGGTQRSIPIFYDADTDEPIDFDPPELKASGRARNTIVGTLGEIGHGKTALAMAVALRLRHRRVGKNRRFTTCIYDARHLYGRPEYSKLCKLLEIEEISPTDYRLNPLAQDTGLKQHELLTMLVRSFQLDQGRKLSPLEVKALRYGLKMLQEYFAEEADPFELMRCLRRMTRKAVLRYQSKVESGGRNKSDALLRKYILAEANGLLEAETQVTSDVIETSRSLADILENMLDGEYGEMFGGEHSPAGMMKASKGMVVIDMSGLTGSALTQFLAMNSAIKTSAMRRGDHSLYYDLEIHDENYELWKDPEYALSTHTFLKQIRSTGTIVFLNTHRLSDYQTVGSESSQQYKLANNMIDDVGIWLLGRHTPKAAEDTAKRLNLTDEERLQLLTLERGVWGLKIGTEPVLWVTLGLTETEKDITFSDDANEEKTMAGINRLLKEAAEEEAREADAALATA